MSKIECVTTSFRYGDFLRETLPLNLPLFDRYIIVTSPDDEETREICRRYGVQCILTKEVWKDGDEFNKGKAIIRGIDHLAANGWVLHLDADIVLPSTFRKFIDAAHLNENKIYGADRVMVKGFDQWKKLKYSGWLQHDYHCRVNFPAGFDVGCRWATEYYGWLPIGYFQLWSGKSDLYRGMHSKLYPSKHSDAARGDVQHALQWDRRDRELIPEIICVHLESEPASVLGANWRGRTTKRFEDKK